MKTLAFLFALVVMIAFNKNTEKVESKVYSFSKASVEKTDSGEKRQLMDGETTHMENFEIHTTMLVPGKAPHGRHVHKDSEEIVFVKEGKLKVTINNESKVVGPGSVALIMPGDEHGLENAGDSNSTYFIIRYKSKQPLNAERGKIAGGSQIIDYDEITFTAHDKGGIRRYFDRKSAESERIEMHATTLNPGIKSHEPHTHIPAEIIVMMKGHTEMVIGEGHFKGEAGDVYFLGSNIPHGIQNIGDEPCQYLAFQFE
jgi:(S)-ureidoglycine aminohydrolase